MNTVQHYMPAAARDDGPLTIALVGNPNCGKTTLFNLLTGSRQKVGNWPGVTVEQKIGHFNHARQRIEVVDLPGTYSLAVGHESASLDQQIAQDFLLQGQADLLVNIIDASSLERGLFLTTQLIDAGLPVVVALNMMDVADEQGMHIDPYKLTEELGCPVVPLIASRGEGKGVLIDVLLNHNQADQQKMHRARLSAPVEQAIAQIQEICADGDGPVSRLVASAILEGEKESLEGLATESREKLAAVAETCRQELDCPLDEALSRDRYRWIADITSGVAHQEQGNRRTLTDWLDMLLLNRVLAFPMFLGVMYLMFMLTINLGSAFIDLFDMTAGVIFVETPRALLQVIGSPTWLTTLIADGAGGGIQLVASFIPVVATLLFFQTFLEDSGYMARVAFVLDRLMRSVGLPGKSFIPLVVGFGCNVPGVMSARTLDTAQDRLLTIIMAPFMSCGARLTVYVLFATAFFPTNGQNVVFGLYVIGMLLAILSGLIVRKQVLRSPITPFLMEMPSYHLPTLRGLFTHTWHRLRGFVIRAGKVIVLIVIVLNFVNSIGTDGSFGNENSENSVLSQIGKSIIPIFEPMGVEDENWPAAVGIFTGIFAKEVVVGTLDSLYSAMAADMNDELQTEEPAFNFFAGLGEAFATVPANLGDLAGSLGDPLGLGFDTTGELDEIAADQEVEVTTLTLMPQLFAGTLGAFCYLLFVLLYVPCVATLAAIHKEAGKFWAIFSAVWNTIIAYAAAVVVFQIGTFAQNPAQSAGWIAAMLVLAAVAYNILIHQARREARQSNLIPAINM